MSLELFPITLEDAFMLSPQTKHFIFRSTHTPAFSYLPGQFITLHFEKDEKTLRRSYSIANVPSQNNRIEIAAGYVEDGPGTQFLFNLKPDDTIQASGPYGRLTLKETQPKRYILVATSTGITPYRSMVAELIKQIETNPSMQIVILQGVRYRNEILYLDEWLALTNKYPQISFRACLSREDKDNLVSTEYSGHVQQLFPDLNLDPENDLIYLCGNPAMIDDAFSQLKEQGFAVQNIIREKYISR